MLKKNIQNETALKASTALPPHLSYLVQRSRSTVHSLPDSPLGPRHRFSTKLTGPKIKISELSTNRLSKILRTV